MAGRSPLVLLVEDLHWASPGLLDFLEHLLVCATDVALLVVVTARKAGHLRRDETRQKRGGGLVAEDGDRSDRQLEEILNREPDPGMAALAADEHRRLMEALGDDELRRVAQRRMEGDSVEEIAKLFGYATRSIKRKLQLIRETWERELTT